MNPLLRAGTLGAVAGSRSMLAPALVAEATGGWLAMPLRLLAAGELAADKLPFIPARTEPLPLAGRIISGAVVGAAVTRDDRVAGAVVGAVGALAASYLLARLRGACSERNIHTAVSGVCEDVAVLAVSAWLLRTGTLVADGDDQRLSRQAS